MSIRQIFPVAAIASLAITAGVVGCGSTTDDGDAGLSGKYDPSMSFNPGTSADGGKLLPRCIDATKQCVATGCTNTAGTTTLSGTVYDPAGKNPLYGIVVYVPSKPPAALAQGAGCYSCNSLYTGDPIAYAVTDSAGKFTLDGIPDGANIPLVVQVGKWRKQYVLPNVSKCADNDAAALTGGKLRLPKNQSEGDLPMIGISTGAADSLECLLRRIGVDASEYSGGAGGSGRIHIFNTTGGADTAGGAAKAYSALWNSKDDLDKYDMTLLTCEGEETSSDAMRAAGGFGGNSFRPPNPLTASQLQALFDYAQGGGRVFASHFHYAWFNTGPFAKYDLAQWTVGTQSYMSDPTNAKILTTLPNGGPFPRGQAMQEWMTNVGALTNGELQITQARHNALVTSANTPSTPWIATVAPANPANQTEYLSFDTPLGSSAAEQCGRVVYSDLHVGAAPRGVAQDYNGYGADGHLMLPAIVPSGCADRDLTEQEKALEFMLFDLSGCITPPDQGAGGVPVITK